MDAEATETQQEKELNQTQIQVKWNSTKLSHKFEWRISAELLHALKTVHGWLVHTWVGWYLPPDSYKCRDAIKRFV